MLFDQFRECIEKTRTNLNEAALLRERAACLELELQHRREAVAAAERTQPTEVAPSTVPKYFASGSEVARGTQPPLNLKLARKMRHIFASAIAEFEVEQDTTATAAGTTSDTAAGITSAQSVELPLVDLEPTVSVAPPTSTHAHVYEPVDVIDVDEPVRILRTTEPTATTSTQSTSFIAHSSVLPRTALSATQSKGTASAAHTTTTLQMQSQYLHPPQTQTVVADIHPPPASFADTPACTSSNVPVTSTAHFPLVELLPPIPTRVNEPPQNEHRPVLTAGTVVPLPSALPYLHTVIQHTVTHTVPPHSHSHYTRTHLHAYTNLTTGTDPHVLTTATTTTTSSSSQPQMYYNLCESIVEQVLRSPTSTSIVSTSHPAAAESSAMPTVASAVKQEPVVTTAAPVSSVVTAAF